MQLYSLIYVFSVATFVWQWQRWVIATESIWLARSKILAFDLLQKKFADSILEDDNDGLWEKSRYSVWGLQSIIGCSSGIQVSCFHRLHTKEWLRLTTPRGVTINGLELWWKHSSHGNELLIYLNNWVIAFRKHLHSTCFGV